MRGIIFWAVILCFMFTCLTQTEAFWGKKKKAKEEAVETQETAPKVKEPEKAVEQKKEPAEKKTDKAQAAAMEAKRALVEKRRKELNNTEWEIELSLLSGKGKKQSDIITFKDNQVSSANFLKQGFSATNYTLTVQEDGTVVWETMQTSEKSGVAFWRGEMDANMQKMQGILSHRIDDKTTRDYSFVSVSKKPVEPPPEKR